MTSKGRIPRSLRSTTGWNDGAHGSLSLKNQFDPGRRPPIEQDRLEKSLSEHAIPPTTGTQPSDSGRHKE